MDRGVKDDQNQDLGTRLAVHVAVCNNTWCAVNKRLDRIEKALIMVAFTLIVGLTGALAQLVIRHGA